MTSELITAGIGLGVSVISSWTTWILARKRYNSEVDHNVIDNMKESLEFYEKLSSDNKVRLTEALEENKKLREDFDEVITQNKQLRQDVDELRRQLLRLTSSICFDLSCQLRLKDYSTLDMKTDEENTVK